MLKTTSGVKRIHRGTRILHVSGKRDSPLKLLRDMKQLPDGEISLTVQKPATNFDTNLQRVRQLSDGLGSYAFLHDKIPFPSWFGTFDSTGEAITCCFPVL